MSFNQIKIYKTRGICITHALREVHKIFELEDFKRRACLVGKALAGVKFT
jgi:hypothetical protein